MFHTDFDSQHTHTQRFRMTSIKKKRAKFFFIKFFLFIEKNLLFLLGCLK
jgi:hypothetical protein